MTAQFSDYLKFNGDRYGLADCSGGALFRPTDHGFNPNGTCTADNRGFACTYGLKGDLLVLDDLYVSHGSWTGRNSYRNLPAPEFGGRVPVKQTKAHEPFSLRYGEVGIPIPFTGGLLIAADFIRAFYVHFGFQAPWKYKCAQELIFEQGRLISHRDVSQSMTDYRTQFADKSLPPIDDRMARIEAWAKATFSLPYIGFAPGYREIAPGN